MSANAKLTKAQRRRGRVFRKASARWELRCAREFQRWQPAISQLTDALDRYGTFFVGQPVRDLESLVSDGLDAFDAIRNQSTGAGYAGCPGWRNADDGERWAALRAVARATVGTDPLGALTGGTDAVRDRNGGTS